MPMISAAGTDTGGWWITSESAGATRSAICRGTRAIRSLSLTTRQTPENTGRVIRTWRLRPTRASAASPSAEKFPSGENTACSSAQKLSIGISLPGFTLRSAGWPLRLMTTKLERNSGMLSIQSGSGSCGISDMSTT